MTVRQRIWLLPAIAIIASILSIGANYLLSTSAARILTEVQAADYPQVNAANALLAAVASLEETLKFAVSANDKNAITALDDKAGAFRGAAAELATLPGQQAPAGALRNQFDAYYRFAADSAAIMLGMRKGDVGVAVREMQTSQAMLRKSLNDYKAAAVARFERHLGDSRTAIREQVLVSLLEGVLVVLGTGITSYFLIPSIIRPIQAAVAIAQAMARGDISGNIEVHGSDELALLLGAMRDMVGSFKRFAAAQQELAVRHAGGDIQHTIAAQQFPGIYGEMARATNELARSHIAVTRQVVEVVTRYALGDLSVDMPRLPGGQAQVTAAIDGVKQSLRAVSAEIAGLVEAAARGNFRARGNAENYQHDFRQMVVELNRLMQVSDTGLSEIARVLGALARGDLTETIANEYEGTFGQLKHDANATVAKMSAIVVELRRSADAIHAVSGKHGAGSRLSNMDQTTAALERLTSIVNHNAEGAAQARSLAAAMRTLAEEGGAVAGRAVQAVDEINDSSRRIVHIIGVIDEIAFQTNLLALNAAVEAARAGEQGRGFAVVAAEVRGLAGRSKAAAQEIKTLIGDSVRKVDGGSQLVNESGTKLREIVTSVKKVSDIIAEIADASREQAQGINQVNVVVTEMDEAMRRNAQDLAQAVALFTVGEENDAPQAGGEVGLRPPRAARA
jgi:methyl-accepting chemotaxis protein